MPSDLRLSCAHSAFPKLSFPVALTVIRDLGFEAVDLCAFEGYDHIPPDQVVADPAAAATAVVTELERAELKPVDFLDRKSVV